MRVYFAYFLYNLRLTLRDRVTVVFSLALPLVYFFVVALVMRGNGDPTRMELALRQSLVIAIIGNGFFGAGIRAVEDRETKVLRRFKMTPSGSGPIVVAALMSGILTFLPVFFLILYLTQITFRTPLPQHLLDLLIFALIGVVAFRSLGLLLASLANNGEEVRIMTQIIYLPMVLLSGASFPLELLPQWLRSLSNFLPSTYLVSGMKASLHEAGALGAEGYDIVALSAAFGGAFSLAIKLFRWEKDEKIPDRARLWIAVALFPFFCVGSVHLLLASHRG